MSRSQKPISNYGLIGNSRTGALISTDGSIDWLCLPRFDSDSVFCSLLDTEIGGQFSITPSVSFRSRHSYLPRTNVLVTKFQAQCGSAELVDCFTVTDERTKRQGLWPDHEILRKLRGIQGILKIKLEFYPTRNYGLQGLDLRYDKRWGIVSRQRNKLLALQTNLPPETIQVIDTLDERKMAVAEFELRAGQEYWFSLIFEDDEPTVWVPLGDAAEDRLSKTLRYWENWIDRCNYSGPYEKQVKRSALALKLLAFAPSGAILAAATTSLPEWIHGSRNWDYRYCWLRDASFTVRVLVSLGYLDEARSFMSWLLHSTRLTRKPWRPRLQVLYSVYGESRIREQALPWLRGYRNSRPVRIGNGAASQRQIDVYGEVVESLRILAPFLEEIDHETQALIIETGEAVLELWDKPDEGIWEPRLPQEHHTHSKILAWVALTRISELAQHYGWKLRHDFASAAAQIREAVETHGYDAKIGTYTGSFGRSELDASLLTLPTYGYCDANSARFQNTIRAIQNNLTRNGCVYRYRPTSDGMDIPEGAFGICNFWMAEALFRSGRHAEGKHWFEALLSRSDNDIGLWSEEINPETGEYLGNYPQAFSHTGLINAAVTCRDCEQGKVA